MGGLVEAVAEHRGREGGTKQAVEPWAGREKKRRGRGGESEHAVYSNCLTTSKSTNLNILHRTNKLTKQLHTERFVSHSMAEEGSQAEILYVQSFLTCYVNFSASRNIAMSMYLVTAN